jgi:hypothetical protein
MRRFLVKILIFTVTCVIALPLNAAQVGDTIVCDGAFYQVMDGDTSVCLVVCDDVSNLVIPSIVQHDGVSYSVVSIGEGAFACSSLTSLSLPSTLQSVHAGAFNGCNGLTTIFSHVTDADIVLPYLPSGALLAVDDDCIDSYSQYDGTLKVLVDVDSEPRSANLCDVNRDGVVTAADVTQVYDHLLGFSNAHGDANGDSFVNAADITAIYDALLEGNTSGVGDRGYCFATIYSHNGHVSMRVGESLRLSVGEEICLVAHDNEMPGAIKSGFEIMKGSLPESYEVELSDGTHAIVLSNKQYNTGATTNAVMYFSTGDTVYYKDVRIEVARHVVTDTLRVLSIGNSFSLDALSYVPFIMKAVAPQIYLKLGIMYIGGGGLDTFYNALDTTAFRYYWSYGARPWNERFSVALSETLSSQPWDVIVLQQQSNKSRDYSTYQPYLNQIIEWLDERATWNHEYAWLITPSYPDNLPRLAPDTTSVQMFERILQCVQNVQQDTGIELLLPCGTAIQNARTTPLDSLGDQGHLFDYLHLQEGIPCLIEAYTASAALLARYGLSDNVWADTTWVDQQWLRINNVQEINGVPVGMTEGNRVIAKQCAIKALENPLSITPIEY